MDEFPYTPPNTPPHTPQPETPYLVTPVSSDGEDSESEEESVLLSGREEEYDSDADDFEA